MRKRILFLTMTVLLLLLCIQTVSADTRAMIYGEKTECFTGDTIKYSVNIKDNPGIAGYLISVSLPDDWMYFDEEVDLGNFTENGSITTSYEPQRINVLWFNADNETGNGSLFSFDVHVSPSTPLGEYPIMISVSDKNTINDKYEMIDFETQNGCITVNYNKVDEEDTLVLSIDDSQNGKKRKLWILITLIVSIRASAGICVLWITTKKKRKK